jgi:peroxiredoxin
MFLFFKSGSYSQIINNPDLQKKYDSMQNRKKQSIGKSIMPFSGKYLDGKYFCDKDIKGKITLINLWFATCAPCIAEFGQLNDVYNRFKNNEYFQMLGITFETGDVATKIKNKYLLDFPILLASYDTCSMLGLKAGYPVSIITDVSGKMIYIGLGGSLEQAEIKERFDTEIVPTITIALKDK